MTSGIHVRITLFLTLMLTMSTVGATELWVDQGKHVLRIDRETGGVLADVSSPGPNAVTAVDTATGALWIYHSGHFSVYDHQGSRTIDLDLDAWPCGPKQSKGKSAECWSATSAELVIQGRSDTGWLVHGRSVYRFGLSGELHERTCLDSAPTAVADAETTPDEASLLVAQGESLLRFRRDGDTRQVLAAPKGSRIRALAYKPDTRTVWTALDKEVRGYTLAGEKRSTMDLPKVELLASGQAGEVWAATGKTLYLVDDAANVQAAVEPFDGSERIVGLATEFAGGSAWVASQSHVAMYTPSEPVSRAAWKKTLVRPRVRSIATNAGVLRELLIVTPDAGSYITHPQPQVAMQYDPPAHFTDPVIKSMTANGQALDVSCGGVVVLNCEPATSLPQGDVELKVRLADTGLFAPIEASTHFIVDTIDPGIAFANGPPPALTSALDLTIDGQVSEPATLTLDGQPLSLDAQRRFSVTVSLDEGANEFRFEAEDTAGNTSVRPIRVTLDTVAPVAPEVSLLTTTLDDGVYTVTGSPGSVEANATVLITNETSGETVTETADADGAFEASIAGNLNDRVTIEARDAAGNASDAKTIPEPSSLFVQIDSPFPGNVVAGNTMTVEGRIGGPENVGVLINGIRAVISDEGRFVATGVPVPRSDFTLRARATSFEGDTITDEIALRGSGVGPSVTFSATQVGLAPLDAVFQYGLLADAQSQRVTIDFDGDGTADVTDPPTDQPVRHVYDTPGVKRATLTIDDRLGERHTATTTIVVRSRDALTQLHQAMFTDMLDRLAADDPEAATRYFSRDSRRKYGPILEELAPHARTIKAQTSGLVSDSVGTGYASYLVLSGGDGESHFVTYMRSAEDGTWRLLSL